MGRWVYDTLSDFSKAWKSAHGHGGDVEVASDAIRVDPPCNPVVPPRRMAPDGPPFPADVSWARSRTRPRSERTLRPRPGRSCTGPMDRAPHPGIHRRSHARHQSGRAWSSPGPFLGKTRRARGLGPWSGDRGGSGGAHGRLRDGRGELDDEGRPAPGPIDAPVPHAHRAPEPVDDLADEHEAETDLA